MNCKILRNKIIYESEIQKLGDFLISDKQFFDIFIRAINFNKKDVLNYIEIKYVTGKIIDKSKFDIFKDIWNDFNSAVKTKKAKQGDLLEYIVTKVKKPLKLVFGNLDYESSCKIYSDKGIDNISSNNCDIDVVLYNLDRIELDDYFIHFDDNVEFLECKHDVNTFLYLNNGKVDKDTLKKLEMFKDIKKVVGQADVKYIFPSFVNPLRKHIDYLKDKGYGFIEVVDGNELRNILFD
jgi:hypothetical protein